MFYYAVLTINEVSVVLRIGVCLVLNFVPDNTCSVSDCLFCCISSHVFSITVLLRCIPGIVFVYITGILKIV